MDYHTLFLFHIVTLALYTATLLILAGKNLRITGTAWFAASAALALTRSVLRLLRGNLPPWVNAAPAQQLAVLAFFFMYLGFRWFVHPRRSPHLWQWLLFILCLAVNTALYLARAYHPFILAMQPGIVLCLIMVYMLLRHGKGNFRAPSRTAAGVLLVQVALSIYRVSLVLLLYLHDTRRHHLTDSRWLYTTFASMLLNSALVLVFAWFFVVESNAILRNSASTDPLTGALNRRAIAQESAREISRAHRSRTPLSIVILDIDHFKAINDRHGHKTGDKALCSLITLLRRGLRKADFIGRLGGEEFVLILPDTGISGAALLAEKLRCSIQAQSLVVPTGLLTMTCTAGVAQLLDSETSFEILCERADEALYRGKSEGRNRVVLAEPYSPQPRTDTLLDIAQTGQPGPGSRTGAPFVSAEVPLKHSPGLPTA